MTIPQPEPWGQWPTRVLPAWYGEFDRGISTEFSAPTHSPGPVGREFRGSFVEIADDIGRPPRALVVLPRDTSRSKLFELPLLSRTSNQVQAALERGLCLSRNVTVGDLLDQPGFGMTSLLDFMCVTEAARSNGFFLENTTIAVASRWDRLRQTVRRQLSPIVSENDFNYRVNEAFSAHPIDVPETDAVIPIDSVETDYLATRLRYWKIRDLYLSQAALELLCRFQFCVRADADDAGIVPAVAIREFADGPHHDHLITTYWGCYSHLLEECGIHRLSNQFALRDSNRARVMAALLDIGRPTTRVELAEHTGLSVEQVASVLSSLGGVIRADRERWGLEEWIEDEYEGIPAEIVQRINEDGGSTRLDRLLDEIPRRFGVSENSVKAYAETPAFRIEHGWVSIANDPAVTVGRFEDVATGRDANGDPYWVFPMYDRYLQGFSITEVPPELAASLGCKLGVRTTVPVRTPAEVRDISVIWRRTSRRGPEIGRIADALRVIGAREGDSVSIVLHSHAEISFIPYGTLRAAHRSSPNDPQGSRQTPTDGAGGRSYTGIRVASTVRGRLGTTRLVQPGNS